jgi:hypothetical protein
MYYTTYYTKNEPTPTTSSTGPITVKSTETVKAISYFPGFATSAVGSGKYTIN